MSQKLAKALTLPPAGSNGAATTPPPPEDPAAALPSRIEEPELSAVLAVRARIMAARAELAEAERDWALIQPIIRHRYQLGEGDEIDHEGGIRRLPDNGEGS